MDLGESACGIGIEPACNPVRNQPTATDAHAQPHQAMTGASVNGQLRVRDSEGYGNAALQLATDNVIVYIRM